MNKLLIISLLLIFVFNCSSSKEIILKKKPIAKINTNILKLTDTSSYKYWQKLDVISDSVSGISWNRARKIFENKKTNNITVAVIDTEMDINHTQIKKYIWINEKEIANNGIDDDHNKYIDDINGWNYLGNQKGEIITDANWDYIRAYRYYNNKFKDLDTTKLDSTQLFDYKEFKNLKNRYDLLRDRLTKGFNRVDNYYSKYKIAKIALKDYFPNYNYTLEVLNKIDTSETDLGRHVKVIRQFIAFNDTDENFKKNYDILKSKLEKRGNAEFNERDILNEDENDINDIGYGNNNVSGNLNLYKHATEVAGVIKEDFIKIMPLAIAPYGETHDKDIALAIRYAVDNGAKIINMSFGKYYSFRKNWVFDALKYAEQHNVLIVSSAGNSRINLDEITTYPNDHNGNGIEVSDNFLMVGGSTREPNENLYYINSNYGATTVDIFAPAVDIYTTLPNNEYITDTGTSLAAALTSKVAALIFSHYPNLTASQVKHIIMDSGVEYTFPVKTPTREDKNKMTPFNELSKSGKIVNAYNALIMADSISRKH